MAEIKSSIIIRAYNAEATIREALESAIHQRFPADQFEVVVVDDGSTDRTRDIVREYGGNRQVIAVNHDHVGGVAAGNAGMASSRGAYVTLLDSDDVFESGFLEELVPFLDARPDCLFVYPDYYETKGKEKKLVSPRTIFEGVAEGILFRKNMLPSENVYRPEALFPEYDLILRQSWEEQGCHYARPLFTYRRRPGSMTSYPEYVRRGLKQLRAFHPDKHTFIDMIRKY